MKIALVAPPYPLSEAPSPPLGLCYVGAAFRAAGAQVRIFDYIVSAYNKDKLARQLAEFAPDVLGTGSVTMNFPTALQILADAKTLQPTLITIIGGAHVSFTARETLEKNPFLDIIVIGEAEATIMELAPLLDDSSQWDDIAGIAFRRAGEIFQNKPRQLIANIDSIPLPARDLLPLSRYKALGFPISMLTSRGCPYGCIFCQGRRLVGAKPRLRSPELVVEEMKTILGMGFGRINIADDLFTIEAGRAQIICEEILRGGLHFQWSAFVRANTVDLETLRLMKRAGCDSVSFGVESGDEEILKKIKKGITLDMAHKAAALCKEAGLIALASFIVGLPSETPDSLERTKNFAAALGCHYGFHILAPFPGTTVREEIEKYDLEILTNEWARYDANQAVIRTSALSARDIEAFVDAFEREITAERDEQLRLWGKNILPPDVEMRLSGYQQTKLIFALLEGDLLEKSYEDVSSNGKYPRSDFYGHIAAATGFERDFVTKVIDSLMARSLIVADGNGAWRWS